MRRNAILRATLPAICRALTQEKGIKLVFQGPPRTDGGVIYSNPMPVDASDDEVTMILGNIDHECGHVRYSDFGVLRREIQQLPSERQSLVKGLAEAIEDTMEERKLIAEFPGCEQTLGDSAVLIEREQGPEAIAQGSPGTLLGHYIDAWGRVNVLQQGVEKSLACAREALCDVLDDRSVGRLDALLSTRLYGVDSTEESFALAYRIERFLDELEIDDDETSGSENEETSQDAGGQSADAQGGHSEPGDGSGTASSGESKEASGGGEGSSRKPHPGARRILEDSAVETTPFFDRRQEAEAKRAAAASRHFVPTDPETVYGEGAGEGGTLSFDERGAERYAVLREALDGPIQQLTRSIVQLYQTATRRRWRSSEEGRIDGRRLALAAMGDPRVFRERETRTLPYPAVGVVLDASSSMQGAKITLTQQAVIALSETNSQLGIPTAIHAFAGGDVKMLKGFDQSFGVARQRVGALHAAGGTPMDQAIWKAMLALMRRRERRKLMFLITDGAPNDATRTREVADVAARMGIEIFGLGIGTDAVKDYCGSHAVLSDPMLIGTAILQAMRDAILRAA